jgi:2-hydroxychromene-2-carboxylate isomerase
MTVSADLDGSVLTVVLDVRHPLAFLALGPAIAFGREMQLAVNWLPRASETLRRPSIPTPEDDRGVRHRRHRAHMIAREIAVYAEVRGLTVQEPYRDAPADAANLAWLWVRGNAPESLESFLVELFRRYWAMELDAGDAGDVSDLLSACGEDSSSFLEWAASEGPAAVEAVGNELAEAGVFTVPAYLVSNQVFYGRQHLPMIRWLLEGRSGPVPI